MWGGLEDDFHHFVVTLRHDGTSCRAARARGPLAVGDVPRRGRTAAASRACRSRIGSPRSRAVTDPRHELHAPVRPRRAVRSRTRRGARPLPSTTSRSLRPPTDVTRRASGATVSSPSSGTLAVDSTGTGSSSTRRRSTEAPWRGGFMHWADATLRPRTAEAAIVLGARATSAWGAAWTSGAGGEIAAGVAGVRGVWGGKFGVLQFFVARTRRGVCQGYANGNCLWRAA